MRFSVQFERYQREFGTAPTYPTRPIVCYWFRRSPGRIGKRSDVVLSPATCRQFRIWAPQALGREKAERIAAWSRHQTRA